MPSPELLILDDNDARLAQFVADVATPLGWQVTATQSAGASQAAYTTRPPAAIMLDLQLGTTDGIEQLRFLRGAGFDGPVVLISVEYRSARARICTPCGRGVGHARSGRHDRETRARRARARGSAGDRGTRWTAPAAAAPLEPPDDTTAALAPSTITPATVSQAIDAGALELFLQPIVDLADGCAPRAEALGGALART